MPEAKMSLIVPETQRLRTPIVKNSRTAIPSAKSRFIQATLTTLLAKIEHERIGIEATADDQCCPASLTGTGKIV